MENDSEDNIGNDSEDDREYDNEYRSKSLVKREAEALQRLGERLTELSSQQLERMELPSELAKAIKASWQIKSHIAGRRHRQYIGTLMRDVESEPIQEALLKIKATPFVKSKSQKETQDWTNRLLTGEPSAIEEFIVISPGVERQRLKQLIRNTTKEKAKAGASKSLKALEQLIKKAIKGK
jgi:ribosome-associated protein